MSRVIQGYVANQGLGGHDELRVMAEMYALKNSKGNNMPLAFSGPAATGKTEVTQVFAEQMLGFAKGEGFMFQIASSGDTRYDFTGLPMIIDGNSVISETPLKRVMQGSKGGIWYLDEVAELPKEVQKDIVSVLDDRRLLPIITIDPKSKQPVVKYLSVENKENFGIVMSYNPNPDSSVMSLFHGAFASRFFEMEFKELPPRLKEYLINMNLGKQDGLSLERRGIIMSSGSPIFLKQENGKWLQNGRKYNESLEGLIEYDYFNRGTDSTNPIGRPEDFDPLKGKPELGDNGNDGFVHKVLYKWLPAIQIASGKGSHSQDNSKTFNPFPAYALDIRVLSSAFAAYYNQVESGNYSRGDAQRILVYGLINNILKGDLKYEMANGETAWDVCLNFADEFIYGNRDISSL